MLSNKNYTFEVSLSTEAYSDKKISGAMIGTTKDNKNREIRKEYGFKANKGISFLRTQVTAEYLLESLLQGKVFCHLFNPINERKDGTFGSSQKKDSNFAGSYVIGVDIDYTNFNTVEEFVNALSIKPTFYYTSYSNMVEKEDKKHGLVKCARFRLIYVFDTLIKNPYYFRYLAWNLNRIIETDTGELIEDDCNLRCSQYFNGTCKDNASIILNYGITNNIYSFEDINADDSSYIDFLCNVAYYKSKNKDKKEIILKLLQLATNKDYIYNNKLKKFEEVLSNVSVLTTINVETENRNTLNYEVDLSAETNSSCFSLSTNVILNDYDRLDTEEFMKCSEWESARRQTKYVYRVEKDWVNNLYQYVEPNYFSLFYYTSTMFDGSKRRKNLFQRMCLRRIMNPSISKDEMVVNTIIDIIRFFDNSDGVLNSDFIKRNVESAFSLTIEDIEEQYADTLKWLRNNTKPKRGIIYINKQAHSKETTYLILDEIYDSSISVTGNLKRINEEYEYIVSKTTIYSYLKDRNIKTDSYKLTDEEIYNIVDINDSFRNNLQFLKDNNIKIGRNRLLKIINNKKNNYNISNGDITSIEVTTINSETEKRNTKNNEVIDSSTSEFSVEQVIEKIDNIDVTSFNDSYEGVEEVTYILQNNHHNMNYKVILPKFYDKLNQISKYSQFIADMGYNKIEQMAI